MSDNNLLEQDDINLNEITAENDAAAVEAEIETEIADEKAAVNAEAVIGEEIPQTEQPAATQTQNSENTPDCAESKAELSAEAEAAAEVYEEIQETATEAEEGNFPPTKPPKKFNKLWIPVIFLSAAVIALAIMTGTLWTLLHNDAEVMNTESYEQTTTTEAAVTESTTANDDNEVINIATEENIAQPTDEYIEIKENGKLTYWDNAVGYAWTPVLEGVNMNNYKSEDFTVSADGRVAYAPNGNNSSFFGIDVSSHQQDIDWQLVREDDVEFAFLRIGFRGYGEEGNIKPDEKFEDNYTGATNAGIGVGVYFFSQAITTDEAVEEANYVLEILNGRPLDYPVVFDWETITELPEDEVARTEDVSAQTLTLSAIAFCDTISAAGYKPMIYTGKKQSILKYDLRKLNEYPKWFAHYNTSFDYCYDFDFWQYGFGAVDGIVGDVDLNVAILK